MAFLSSLCCLRLKSPLFLKVKPVHTSARPLQDPAPVSASAPPSPNSQIHASSTPAFVENQPFTINVTQNIRYTDINGKSQGADQFNLTLTKKFELWVSVYPPPGHSDYWNILPHVLFNDPETPWLFETPWLDGDPWLALFVFTHDELLVSDDSLDNIAFPIKTVNPNVKFAQNTNMSIPMTNVDFKSLAPSSAKARGTGNAWGSAQTQAIFIPTDLFRAIMPRDKIKSPWLMNHVRSVEVTGMTDMDAADSGTSAVTVSQRTGPLNPTTPTIIPILSSFQVVMALERHRPH